LLKLESNKPLRSLNVLNARGFCLSVIGVNLEFYEKMVGDVKEMLNL
jgi:hypothetical protein